MQRDDSILTTEHLNFYYGDNQALYDISISIPKNRVTALIGPSGCGKSTLLRCFDRLSDLVENVRIEGRILFGTRNIRDPDCDVVDLRKRIGMVFQKPNPFPSSIYDNIAYGPRVHGVRNRDTLDGIVQESLKKAALWDEVADRLNNSAMGLSGGQQQRLCIARTLAVEPDQYPQGTLHHRHRDPQHAAGGPGQRLCGVHVPWAAGGVRADHPDL